MLLLIVAFALIEVQIFRINQFKSTVKGLMSYEANLTLNLSMLRVEHCHEVCTDLRKVRVLVGNRHEISPDPVSQGISIADNETELVKFKALQAIKKNVEEIIVNLIEVNIVWVISKPIIKSLTESVYLLETGSRLTNDLAILGFVLL
jgi:hypothetical protein